MEESPNPTDQEVEEFIARQECVESLRSHIGFSESTRACHRWMEDLGNKLGATWKQWNEIIEEE